VKVQLQVFLISTPDKHEWSASRLGHFARGETAPVYTEQEEQWAHSRFGISIEKKKFSYPRQDSNPESVVNIVMYSGADKSLARPGRKQSNVSIRMAPISFGALPCMKKKIDDSSHLNVVEIARVPDMLPSFFPFWLG